MSMLGVIPVFASDLLQSHRSQQRLSPYRTIHTVRIRMHPVSVRDINHKRHGVSILQCRQCMGYISTNANG